MHSARFARYPTRTADQLKDANESTGAPWDDVELYTSQSVSGTRAAAYFGPISAELFVEDNSFDDRTEA